MQEQFGELRSVIHNQRGKPRWEALVAMLEDWPVAHLEQVVVPYLLDNLADDEDELREAPTS